MASKCKECGCTCKQCLRKNSEIHLHAEIENLRQRLLERDNHIVTMETQFLNDANKFPNGELASIREEILIWQDKYARLYEAHKRIQKVNQNLEDKLLRIVDKCETEKGAFIKDIATLSHRLADANYAIHRLKQDNDKYRNDVNLAIQLLQCKPSNFVGQKYDTLPLEVQAKVRSYVAQKNRPQEEQSHDVKSITVPISNSPPTAMVYSVTKSPGEKLHADMDDSPPVDVVSASIMARVLEDREKERIFGKHCSTCNCSKTIFKVEKEVQTCRSLFNDSPTLPCHQNPIVIGYMDGNDSSTILRFNGQYNNMKLQSNDTKSKSVEIKRNSRNCDVGKSGNKNGMILSENCRIEKSDQNWKKVNDKDEKDTRNKEGEGLWKIRQEEIVNERLYKNSWKKYWEEFTEEKKEASEIEKIDAINDRVWKKTRCTNEEPKSTHLTVIEVASSDELAAQNRKTETTASPSFSSDSVVISSSDPSSLSSDSKSRDVNHEISRLVESSSRNCLVRVKPGSKNILLDSIGTYQTVLYTSGSERPNTILVHSKSRLDRSGSISSDDNVSDVPTRDASQLQRVAEWVESSNAIKIDERKDRKSVRKTQKVLPIFTEKPRKEKLKQEDICAGKGIAKEKDLITFEASSEEDNKDSFRDPDYEVKVTKEMEETYLKLTASLDPAKLKLNESERLGITIEKYRQDYKKCLQKVRNSCET